MTVINCSSLLRLEQKAICSISGVVWTSGRILQLQWYLGTGMGYSKKLSDLSLEVFHRLSNTFCGWSRHSWSSLWARKWLHIDLLRPSHLWLLPTTLALSLAQNPEMFPSFRPQHDSWPCPSAVAVPKSCACICSFLYFMPPVPMLWPGANRSVGWNSGASQVALICREEQTASD